LPASRRALPLSFHVCFKYYVLSLETLFWFIIRTCYVLYIYRFFATIYERAGPWLSFPGERPTYSEESERSGTTVAPTTISNALRQSYGLGSRLIMFQIFRGVFVLCVQMGGGESFGESSRAFFSALQCIHAVYVIMRVASHGLLEIYDRGSLFIGWIFCTCMLLPAEVIWRNSRFLILNQRTSMTASHALKRLEAGNAAYRQ